MEACNALSANCNMERPLLTLSVIMQRPPLQIRWQLHSCNEATRLMNGGEQVNTIPAAPAIIEALAAFAQEHDKPVPKKSRRKPSFEDRAGAAQMARAEGDTHGS